MAVRPSIRSLSGRIVQIGHTRLDGVVEALEARFRFRRTPVQLGDARAGAPNAPASGRAPCELVISTGADALSADELAGALIVLAETKDAGKREAWAKRGAAFFQGQSRRTASAPDRDTRGAPAQPGGAQPASGGAGTA